MTAIAAVGWVLWRGNPDASATASTLEINPPEGRHFTPVGDIGRSAISPDGRTLAFVASTVDGRRRGQTATLVEDTVPGGMGAVSPDGRWAAYHSNETGRNEIYVPGYPELRGKRQVSQGGGDLSRWRSDGRELYWLAPGNTVMAAEVKPGQAGIEPWFQASSDGKRFLVMEPEGGTERDLRMVVIQNWPVKLGNQP